MRPHLACLRLLLPVALPLAFAPSLSADPVEPLADEGYAAFEAANGISGAGADEDSDGDGIANGIEFVIGGDPSGPDSDSNALRPLIVNTDPEYVDFIFRRTDDSAASNPYVQYGSSLTGWTDAEPGVPEGNPVVIDETNDHFGEGIDRVTVRIPRALAEGQKLFVRLLVDIQ